MCSVRQSRSKRLSNSAPQIIPISFADGPKCIRKMSGLYKHREILRNVNFIMGVGGSFDVIAGKVNRAPLWMQKAGM